MQKRQLITVMMFFFGMLFSGVHAQTHSVSGVVKDKVPGDPLVGVTVTIKGSSTTTVTDINGNYSIQASPSDELVFTYVSMNTVTEKVGDRKIIDVIMTESDESLGEVVVTALGIKREAKSLAYSAQTVGGKDVNEIKNVNMINSLQGKSAGLTITPNATGAGGASKILFRGSKSISGSNQPLVVLDGVPLMMNISDTQVASNYGGDRDGGDALSQINPDDIAQITLLKGASAAALYGAVAANGAIMITTKSAQAGKVSINVSSNTTIETPISLPKFQTAYGMSDSGTFSWGDKLSAKADDYAKKFYRTGFTANNSVSVAGGNEHISSYFSYGNVRSNGIVPENTYYSHNLLAKVGFEILPKLHLDASASYNKQHIKNQMASGYLNNPLTGAYLFPRGENWNDYKDNYEVYDPVLNTNVQRWTNVKQEQYSNPYWMIHRQVPISDRNRYDFGGSIKYEIIDGLSVMGRLRFERGDERWIYNEYASSTGGRNLMGTMKDSRIFNEQFYGDLLATYNHVWLDTYALTVTAGTSFTKTKGNGAEIIGWGDSVYTVIDGKPTGNAYYPNIFSPNNYYRLTPNYSQNDKRLNSVFGTAQFGYKDGLFVDVTARNDWSSALAYTDGVSFFYPSVGTSLLLDKFINFGHNVNMLKLRASYSVVGNDVPVFMSNLRYKLQNDGSLTPPERAPFRTLKPEKTHSLEVGFEGTFFDNRLETNITYYKTNTKNQFFAVDAPWETGLRQRYVNAGNVRNQGVEISLSWYQQFNKDFSWITRFNYAYNANKIIELVEGLNDLTLANYGSAKVILKEGGHYGDLYVRQVKRDENGKPIVDKGAPQLGGDGNDQMKYAGDMTPRTTVGWSNTFNYKDFTLSFLIDGKFGGKILSLTEATLDGWGVSERSGEGRNAGKVVLDGQEFDAAKYYRTVGATNFNSQYAAELYLYKATNIRLRELSLGYTFRNLFGHNKNLTASLIGRNLFFFYKDAPIDPDVSVGTGNGWQGVDIFSLPSSRSMGLNLKLNF
jgi:TonB-linked SusC/RagA family outer membrane protein